MYWKHFGHVLFPLSSRKKCGLLVSGRFSLSKVLWYISHSLGFFWCWDLSASCCLISQRQQCTMKELAAHFRDSKWDLRPGPLNAVGQLAQLGIRLWSSKFVLLQLLNAPTRPAGRLSPSYCQWTFLLFPIIGICRWFWRNKRMGNSEECFYFPLVNELYWKFGFNDVFLWHSSNHSNFLPCEVMCELNKCFPGSLICHLCW